MRSSKGKEKILNLASFDLAPLHSAAATVNLAAQFADRALLIVNTASRCGFAEETHAALNELHRRYAASGLAILAFPSNDFDQEPGDADAIASFAKAKGAEFDTFARVSVGGGSAPAHPL